MNATHFDTTYPRKLLRTAEIFKTIAHPVRINILKLLNENGQMNVTDIQEKLGCDCEQSMLSHHLNKMKDKNILQSSKSGKFIYYSIIDPYIQPLLKCMNTIDS